MVIYEATEGKLEIKRYKRDIEIHATVCILMYMFT
jgi:hypothetical protein